MTSHVARTSVAVVVAALLLSTAGLPAQTDSNRFNGKPVFSEGDALGYFVWRDGDTWKLRWTTFGAEHRFSGRITLDGGELRSFKRIDVDTERKVIAPGRGRRVVRGPAGRARVAPGRPAVVATREEDHIEQEGERLIRFTTRTDDDLDGLEFKVTAGTEAIRLVLEIDGAARPEEVEVGADNFKPNQNPLVIRLR